MDAKEIEAKIKAIGEEKAETEKRLEQAKKDIAEVTRYYNQSFKFLAAHELKKREALDAPLSELGRKYAEWELERQKLKIAITAYEERLKIAGELRDKLHEEILQLGVAIGAEVENLRFLNIQKANHFLVRF